jgi:predicted flap endonuclease-1-like 5' DNA nuclease
LKACKVCKDKNPLVKKRLLIWLSVVSGFLWSSLLIYLFLHRKSHLPGNGYPGINHKQAKPEIMVEKELVKPVIEPKAGENKTETGKPKKDDLAKIWGIGPKISNILYSIGITSYDQLSKMDPADIRSLLLQEKIRLNNAESWPKQAELAAKNKWDLLIEYQKEIKTKKS